MENVFIFTDLFIELLFALVIFIADLAYDLFDDILHSDQPSNTAVFIHYQRHVHAARLHLTQ